MLPTYDAPTVATLMGLPPATAARPTTTATIEHAVEQGLPRAALRHVIQRIAGADPARITRLEHRIVPKTTLERRTTRLSPEESERTERLARLFAHAIRALGSEDEARAFLTTPHPMLENRIPLEAARTDLATRRVEHILHALKYGLAP